MPRYAQLLIANDLLIDWIRHGAIRRAIPTGNLLPEDVRLAGVYNAHPGMTGLVFESMTFDEVDASNAAMLPLLPPPVFRSAGPAPDSVLPSVN
jgi:hypothetical protein